MYKKIYIFLFISNSNILSKPIRVDNNDKDLQNDFNQENSLDRRRRPPTNCNFNGQKTPVYKTDGLGRTFVDFSFVNVGYNYQYNVNCGGGNHNPGNDNNYDVEEYQKPGVDNKPGLGHHKPGHHKPGYGHKPGFGQQGNGPPHRPLLMNLLANRPFQSLFAQSNPEQPSVINNIASSVSGIFPSPAEFGQGLGDGISSFVQTLPQIGQSFQSLLPNFDNFQWPQFGSSSSGQNIPVVQTTVPNIPIDDIKPVHEEHDPITDPYKIRQRFGNQNYPTRNRQEEYILSRNNVQRFNEPRNYQYAQGPEKTNAENVRFPVK